MGNFPVLCFITGGYSLFPNLIIYLIVFCTVPSKMVLEKVSDWNLFILDTQIELQAHWGSAGMTSYARCPRQWWWRFAALSLLSMSRGAVGLIELVLSKALKHVKMEVRKEVHIRGILLKGDGSRRWKVTAECWGSAFFLQSWRCVSYTIRPVPGVELNIVSFVKLRVGFI